MKLTKLIFIAVGICFCCASIAFADPGDTTTVTTFVRQNHNWGSSGVTHTETFAFPDGSVDYNQITMTYRISCPNGGCDPWDRIGNLYIVRATSDTTEELTELARIITPYNIVGAGYPGTCTWEFDVIDYMPLLQGEVTLRSTISTYIGDPLGWECTVTFYFVEGSLPIKPYRVVNLWSIGYIPYGDPERPPEDLLGFSSVYIDDFAELAMIRIYTTGHGQGNTSNAAEFSRKDHGVFVGAEIFQQELWRNNCGQNECSPQGGTWQYNRAGWCPGDRVYPWDVTGFDFVPGQPIEITYFLENYENFCRPTNPDCIDGSTCADCDYNSTGHTEPNFYTSAQLFLWSSQIPSGVEPPRSSLPTGFALMQNYPNPFNPSTTIRFSIPKAAHAKLSVYNIAGQEVETLVNGLTNAGPHQVDFNAAALPSGVYFYSLSSGGFTDTKKMLLLK